MAVRFICECGKKLKAADDKIGKKILCSGCGQPLVIPEMSTIGSDSVISTGSSIGMGSTITKSPPEEKPATKKTSKPKTKAQRAKTKGSASDAAANHLGVNKDNASTIAKQLMAQTKREAKEKANTPSYNPVTGQVREEAKYDYVAFLTENIKIVGAIVAGVPLLYFFSSWLLADKSTLPPLGEVSGVITCEGKPVPDLMVMFRTVRENDKGKRLGTGVGITDAQGQYTLKYNKDALGAVVGENKVYFRLLKGPQVFDSNYLDGLRTTLSFDVQEGTNKDVDFKLAPLPPGGR